MRVLLAVGAVLLLAGSAAKGGPEQYHLVQSDLSVSSTVVQQPGVVNPTGCLWDVDDSWTAGAAGRRVEAGVVASISVCLVADGHPPFWGVRVRGDSEMLLVTLSFQPQNVTWTLAPVFVSGKTWEYRGCLFGPSYSNWLGLSEIGGGHGLLTTVTATVANPTSKAVANPDAVFIERPGLRSAYCDGVSADYDLAGANWSAAGPTP